MTGLVVQKGYHNNMSYTKIGLSGQHIGSILGLIVHKNWGMSYVIILKRESAYWTLISSSSL